MAGTDFAEVVNGAIIQTFGKYDTVNLSTGEQYNKDFPKEHIPNVVAVVDPGKPDPTQFTSTSTVVLVSGVPTVQYQTTPVGADFIAATLAAAKTQQTTTLSQACRTTIISGFQSSALGQTYTYPSKLVDQSNLTGAVLLAQNNAAVAGWSVPLWCESASGVWTKVPHTSSQVIQVGTDLAAWVQTCTTKLSGVDGTSGLLSQVNAATTVEAVGAITW